MLQQQQSLVKPKKNTPQPALKKKTKLFKNIQHLIKLDAAPNTNHSFSLNKYPKIV